MTEKGLLERARRLGIEVENTQALMERLDAARQSLEAARGQISMIIDEMRMQSTISKERTAWCIRELDKLRAQFEALLPPSAP